MTPMSHRLVPVRKVMFHVTEMVRRGCREGSTILKPDVPPKNARCRSFALRRTRQYRRTHEVKPWTDHVDVCFPALWLSYGGLCPGTLKDIESRCVRSAITWFWLDDGESVTEGCSSDEDFGGHPAKPLLVS